MGIGISDIIGIVSFVINGHKAATAQLRAIGKHICRFYVTRVPVIITVNGGEFGTTIKHPIHVGDFLRVKHRKVEFGQRVTLIKHIFHIGNLLCIETRKVEGG